MEIVFLIFIYIKNSAAGLSPLNGAVKNLNKSWLSGEGENTLSISSAREQLKQCKDNYKLPSNFNWEEFRLVANGFFQAEGHISCRISGKYFRPVFAINQNLSAKSLEFFLTLWHVLGRTGTLGIIMNKHGKMVIRLSSES